MEPITRHDRTLDLLVGMVLLVGLLAVVFGAMQLRGRQLALSDINLERSQQELRERIDVMVERVDGELMRTAAELMMSAHPDTTSLRNAWEPLFAADPALVTIRLADDEGNEVTLERAGDERTRFAHHRALQGELPEGLSITGDTAVYQDDHDDGDPRMSTWYSKALEDARGMPVWNLRRSGPGTSTVMQVSHLVRSSRGDPPFHVLAFEIDLDRSGRMSEHGTYAGHTAVVLHDGDGRVVRVPGMEEAGGVLGTATRSALELWTLSSSREAFTIQVEDHRFRAISQPVLFNGESLHGLTVIDVAMMSAWTDAERNALLFAAAWIALLIVLFAWSWSRRAEEARQMARQTRLRESQERRLEKALGEREVLNREVHHRVKNNLQVVSSLLNLQMARMDDDRVRQEFLRGKRRIDTIALVHHKLYGLKDLRNVDLHLFFTSLVDATKASYLPLSERVSCEILTNDLRVDQDTAIELGIILCELLGNAMQHAFPYATGGHVDIVVQPVEGDLYRLLVKDNGRGMSVDAVGGPGKLGLEIVEALAEQLDGSFHRRSNGGTVCEVTFRMRH